MWCKCGTTTGANPEALPPVGRGVAPTSPNGRVVERFGDLIARHFGVGFDGGGADPVSERPGFAQMLERLMSNGARTLIVESPDRFARELMVQLAGHDMLKARGVTLIAASAPMHFVEDTPTAVLVRQVLGAVAEFEKTTLVAKLAAARRRKRTATGEKVEGRKSHAEERRPH
jgi:DNA invertase Pin-like site-specific DNA recombinase